MKKIFTLLFAVGLFAIAQAQPGNRDKRDKDDRKFDQRDKDDDDDDRFENKRTVVVNHDPYDNRDDRYENDNRYGNDNRNGNSRFGNERRMRMQIAQINREYDYKMERVSRSNYLSRWEKEKQFRLLEDQRRYEIKKVYKQFKYKNRYDDREFSDRRHNY